MSAPKGFVKGGESVKVTITGAEAGERVCVFDSSGGAAALTGTGSPLTYEVDTAKKGGDVTVSATTGRARRLTSPGPRQGAAEAEAGQDRQAAAAGSSVALRKLGAKEKVKLYVDGKLVATGKATKKGVFKGPFRARLKPGKHTLKVVGRFKNRVGTATFRVVD